MIIDHTYLDVADNTGAKKVMCIKVLGGAGKKTATVGDKIVIVIKSAAPSSKVKKGDVHKAIIVRVKKKLLREDGTFISFDTNSVVLIDQKGEPLGTRVFGPVVRELRNNVSSKILSLAPEIL